VQWSTWEINYRGVYWVTKDFLPLLLGTPDGLKTVLNVSSIGAHGLRPGHSAYQTTKNALLRFTEFLMAEYFEEGLLAYAIVSRLLLYLLHSPVFLRRSCKNLRQDQRFSVESSMRKQYIMHSVPKVVNANTLVL
jgi:NAD(P)-dependent dehydrogenase (short-subunit alcohol dehydrogenase family)